jgi:hypothetical protein
MVMICLILNPYTKRQRIYNSAIFFKTKRVLVKENDLE